MENLCINNISFSINAFLLIQHLLYNNMKKRVINACMPACTFFFKKRSHTTVCTTWTLWWRIEATQLMTSTNPSRSPCLMRKSRAIKVPVRPTPALKYTKIKKSDGLLTLSSILNLYNKSHKQILHSKKFIMQYLF